MYFVSSRKSSGSYWLSYNALPSPLHSPDKACKRESRYDLESTKYYQAFFMKGKQNISSLHKNICSLVSILLLYIKKVVAACKVCLVNIFSVKPISHCNIIRTNQSWRINGENVCYTRLECKKAYSNKPIVYSKWPSKWSEEQKFWEKLGFRESMITTIKKCKWHKYKLNQKLPSCMSLRKKNYNNPMTQFWNIYYQKTSKIAILSPFL